MTQNIATPSTQAGSDDPQRAALAELVSLAAEFAAAETQISADHQSENNFAKRTFTQSVEQIDQQNAQQRRQLQQQLDHRTSEADLAYQSASEETAAHAAAATTRLNYEHDAIAHDVKAKLQHAIWLAESVFEGSQNQLAKEAKLAAEKLESRRDTLAEFSKRAAETLYLYGQPRLAAEPSIAPVAETGGFDEHRELAAHRLEILEHLQIPRMFVGVRPYIILAAAAALAGIIAQWIAGGLPIDYGTFQLKLAVIGYAAGATVLGCVLLGFALMFLGRSQTRAAYAPLREAIENADAAAQREDDQSRAERQKKLTHATRNRDTEISVANEKYAPLSERATRNRVAAFAGAQTDRNTRESIAQKHLEQSRSQTQSWHAQEHERLETSHRTQWEAAQKGFDDAIAAADKKRETASENLTQRWHRELHRIESPLQDSGADASQNDWKNWTAPTTFPRTMRFGQFRVDLKQITDQYPQKLILPKEFSVPATLVYPDRGSLLIHTDHAGHEAAITTQRAVMTRLLAQLPPGRVKFTIIDPVGLGQNFAGFMHLADHDESLVGSRIWTEANHIEQQLANLTEHMETVIQKYLRNEFATIDEYNAQAGELAEPYRYLVIADFPVGFEGDAFRRLASIATSGARCGVFMLIVRDIRQPLPSGMHIDELQSNSINLVRRDGKFIWRDEIFQQFPLELDSPPADETLNPLLEKVGRAARLAKRVEVPFESIAPPPDKFWSGDSKADLQVPIGRLGASRLQMLRLGRGVAQHALIAGKTGSGKSTLLHVLITNLALWYSPDQVEFYLVDFKKGVEFKTYATHHLPHARAIAVESDREFGLSVLQRIDAELIRRGEMFRKLGVQDLAGYRNESTEPLPRTLLIIDEFQEFFSEDDKLAQEAALLLDRLVRQGRAFGIHVLLGSQTIGGTSGLSRSTIGQIAIRVALQTSEADSQLILGDANSAARLLSRPGEAIYNDAGGLVENNSPFQISWLPDARREIYLDQIAKRNDGSPTTKSTVVFEGNQPADITQNQKLKKLLDSPRATSRVNAPLIWLGDPVAIKDPTSLALRPQSGANVVVIGQNEEAAMATLAAAMLSLSAQQPKDAAKFFLLDGTAADSSLAGKLKIVADALPQEVEHVEYRAAETAMQSLGEELDRRLAADQSDSPAIYIFINGLQRYRALRKREESFNFSPDDAEKKPSADKRLGELLRDGPAVGMHVIAWIDTAASIDRTFDRGTMREFDFRVLFQMSASDSSNLIDSPLANKLGANRVLLFSEELGIAEKFRPYALPEKAWVDAFKK